MVPVKPLPPRPKNYTRFIGVMFPDALLTRVISVKRDDESTSDVIRRLCDLGVNALNQGGSKHQK